MVVVRQAEPRETEALSAMLARAFFADPVASYLFPDAACRKRQLARFFRLQLRFGYFRTGEVLTTDSGEGAVLGLPPESSGTRSAAVASSALLPVLLGRRARVSRELGRMLAARRPVVAHYYVGTLGTEPERQRKGVGSALLGSLLSRCDSAGMPAYLECSREQTLDFYRSRGFEVAEMVSVAPQGPPMWLMVREPLGQPPR